MRQLTEAEAWLKIGEAFEAKHEHPELDLYMDLTDIADWGLCNALSELFYADDIDADTQTYMDGKIDAELDAQLESSVFLQPEPSEENGSIVRAMLAYLFAAEAAA